MNSVHGCIRLIRPMLLAVKIVHTEYCNVWSADSSYSSLEGYRQRAGASDVRWQAHVSSLSQLTPALKVRTPWGPLCLFCLFTSCETLLLLSPWAWRMYSSISLDIHITFHWFHCLSLSEIDNEPLKGLWLHAVLHAQNELSYLPCLPLILSKMKLQHFACAFFTIPLSTLSAHAAEALWSFCRQHSRICLVAGSLLSLCVHDPLWS